MHLQFQGAARTVTGSMHVLTVGGRTILPDCGIYHSRRDESRERNSLFPFDPSAVSAVVLSHAHIDHSGNIPTLVRQGFRGPVFCAGATKSLCEVMFGDSGYIQQKDAKFINKKHRAKGLPAVMPLYAQEDVDATLPLPRGEPHALRAEVVVLNSFSGHADRSELLQYIGNFPPGTMKGIFLVHGDPDQSEKLGTGLREYGFLRVGVPARGDETTLA